MLRAGIGAGVALIVLSAPSVASAAWTRSGTATSTAKASGLQTTPGTVTVAGGGSASVVVDATAPSSTLATTGYKIDRSTPATTLACTAVPCTDTGRTGGTTYGYKVTPKTYNWLSSAVPSTVSATVPTTALYPTDIAFENGPGTRLKPDTGDTITMRLSAAPTAASVCAGWSGTSSLPGVTVSMARGNGSATNDLTFTRAACTGGLNVAASLTASAGTYNPVNALASWTSTLTLSASTLTITLGACTSGCGNVAAGEGVTYTYTPDTGLRSAAGSAPSGTAAVWGELF